jgi:hypothetical protein
MFRMLVVIVIAVAALWYFTRDTGNAARIAEQQIEEMEMAKESVSAVEDAAAAMAAQSDAIRDQTMGAMGNQQGEQEAQ